MMMMNTEPASPQHNDFHMSVPQSPQQQPTQLQLQMQIQFLQKQLQFQQHMQEQQQSRSLKRQRRVQFSTVDVREMGMIVGDHPSTTQGPPVTIEWIPQRQTSFDLDQVEEVRETQRRSSKDELRLSCWERTKMLLQTGYSSDELLEAAASANKVQKQRQETIKVLQRERKQQKLRRRLSNGSSSNTSRSTFRKHSLSTTTAAMKSFNGTMGSTMPFRRRFAPSYSTQSALPMRM